MVYNTKQRRIILEYLMSSAEHVTVNDIVEHLTANGTRVGTATVYRFLEHLLEEGKVRRFSSADGACYQWSDSGECKNHYHFVCNNCGELLHVECSALDRACSHIFKEHNFKIDMGKTVFCGECEKCAKERLV